MVAFRTAEFLFSSVYAHMPIQQMRVPESQTALTALIALSPIVGQAMHTQLPNIPEWLVAVGAYMSVSNTMRGHVRRQRFFNSKIRITNIAHKWPLPGMNAHMS